MTSNLPPEVRERTQPDYWYRRANIPKHLWSTDWNRFDGTGAEKAADTAFELVEGWLNEGETRGISLFGNPGRGKTTVVATMLCAYIEATMPRNIDELFSDVQCYFITLDEYHRLYLKLYELDRWAKRAPGGEVNDAYMEWGKNSVLRTFIEEEVPYLVLDDVGNEHQTSSGAVQDEFHTLIRGRYARGLSTSITSNLTDEKFVGFYGAPQLSFIQEATEVVRVTGHDFRRKGRG